MSPKSGSTVIEVRNLFFSIGAKEILRNVSFSVGNGQLIALVGPNGSGKTTLLRLLDGILYPDKGCVCIEGKNIHGLRDRERARIVSYMPQIFFSNFNLTVKDLVLMGRYPYRERGEAFNREDEEIALRAIEYVGLSTFAERPFNELSGGERQLTLLAKVLCQETNVILLDEPSSSLDIKHQDEIFSILYELTKEGKTIITSVHNLNVASRYAYKILMLSSGELEIYGTVDKVITPALIGKVYGVKVTVSPDASTGFVNVSVVPRQFGKKLPKVHIIGGAGSAINITRELFRLGYKISGGIAHRFDSDLVLWENLGIENVNVDAFSPITDYDIKEARHLVESADITILCEFPIGSGNVGNLRLAEYAKNLFIVKSKVSPLEGYCTRSFYNEEAREFFIKLSKRAEVISYNELIALLS